MQEHSETLEIDEVHRGWIDKGDQGGKRDAAFSDSAILLGDDEHLTSSRKRVEKVISEIIADLRGDFHHVIGE